MLATIYIYIYQAPGTLRHLTPPPPTLDVRGSLSSDYTRSLGVA